MLQPLRRILRLPPAPIESAIISRAVRPISVSCVEMNPNKFALPERYGTGEKSVWVEYIQLALDYKPQVNLGQGFPDFAAPCHVTKALSNATTGENVLLNQYTRGFGHPRLVNALSKLYSKLLNRQLNPFNEMLVTAGAYEALYSAIMGHVDFGDEVIIIEPFFDCYEPMVKMAGGTPKFIPLEPRKKDGVVTSADWVLDEDKLRNMFNDKTKMIILNTPHNPLGKVFSVQELTLIADLCKKHNVLCVSDEVYEWMVYKPNQHVRIATLPGMFERTITIGSAGKTFSVTGWKTGWAYGPADIMANLYAVHQNCVYTCNTPVQEAVAVGFEYELARYDSPDCYFFSIVGELEPKRDFMVQFLKDIGMTPTVPEAGYFMIADWSSIANKVDLSDETDAMKDYKFTKYMTKNVSVQGIPPSAFYSKDHKKLGEDYIRFCFIKKDENLQKAAELLKKWSSKLNK